MQFFQLFWVMDPRRVVSDTDKGLVQTLRHPGGFCFSCVLVLAVPECAETVGRVWMLCNTARRCAKL